MSNMHFLQNQNTKITTCCGSLDSDRRGRERERVRKKGEEENERRKKGRKERWRHESDDQRERVKKEI
jgi:hypothetical protein